MGWYALPTTVPWLTLAVVIPLSGALLVGLTPSVARGVIKQLGILASAITLLLVLVIVGGFQLGVGNLHLQFEEARQWVPAVGISYHVGVDGLSLFLLGLNGLLFLIAILVTSPATLRLKQFILLLLILEAATAGILLSLDLILFYVFWEAMLVPLYFLIGVWGEGPRVYAAFKFLIYTVIGSFAMLVAILAVAAINFAQTGQLSFDWTVLVQHPASGVWQLPLNLGAIGIPQLLFLGFALAFAIKMPLFPLHTWLPAAYTASPIPVVIVLAGLVSKLGAYGFLRFNLALFPDAAHSLGPALAVLATAGILYGAFLIMLGAWTAFVPLAVGAGLGVILAAWYVLRFYQGSFQEAPPQPAGFGEMRVADAGVLAPLLALMIVIGVSPAFFPAAVEATVKALPVLLR